MAEANTIQAPGHATPGGDPLAVGARVDVCNRYVGSWARGFEVARRSGATVWVRRLSDGAVLPEPLQLHEVRPAPTRPTWWA